jgi:hypothetical protein
MAKLNFGLGSTSKNDAKSQYGVSVTFYNATIDSNIMDEVYVSPSPPAACDIIGLDFSCQDNSQYIGAL